MAKTNCKLCGGSGYVMVSQPDPEGSTPSRISQMWREKKARCRCALEQAYHKKLGGEIFNAEQLDYSEYVELTDQNLFVKSARRDFMPHLKYALQGKGLDFFFRTGNDSIMLDAWLSKGKDRSIEEGTTEHDFTSLRDFAQDPALLIVFLCVVSYPNKALPSVLLETLRIRDFEGKPTWVVNPHAHPFTKGHLCWSTETEAYISENFTQKTLDPTRKFTPLSEGVVQQETQTTNTSTGRRTKKVGISLNDLD